MTLPFLLASLAFGAGSAPYGILLLAHGGDADWDREVTAIRRELDRRVPTELALGMADTRQIQKGLDWLAARQVSRVVAVPLFVNSRSEVLDHTRWILGLREKPSQVLKEALASMPHRATGAGGHASHHSFSVERARLRLPVAMAPALDDHPLVAGILLDRARTLSKDPSRETVVLVAHGPVDEKADKAWLKTLARLAWRVRRDGGFKAVYGATIRDDSPAPVKEKAKRRLRGLVERAGQHGGAAIVIPVLVARGGIEHHVPEMLAGLDYRWNGATLCPHPNVARWALESAERAAR